MMRLALFVLTLLATVSLQASPSPAKWTVMVFMNATGDMERNALDDLVEMRRALPAKGINVVVQCKRDGNRIPGSGLPVWKDALRFRIGDKVNRNRSFPANMADKATLRDFITWSKRTYPAERYALVIWAHGTGWRRFQLDITGAELSGQGEPEASGDVNRRASREAFAPVGMRHTSYKASSADGNDLLMNAEVAEAIADAMGGTKLGVLAFDSCLMQMMETAWAFRDVATMLVASEDLVPGQGFRYDMWLRRLVAAPSSDAVQLAKILVDAYATAFSSDPRTTLSAVDLTRIPALASRLSEFADALRNALPHEAALIARARRECAEFAPYECVDGTCFGGGFLHVDLRRFADRVASLTGDETIRAAAKQLSTLLGKTVLDPPWAGAKRDASTEFGSHGIAIYFPADKRAFVEDEWNDGSYDKPSTNRYPEYPVSFVTDHRWADFLHAYFAAVPGVR